MCGTLVSRLLFKDMGTVSGPGVSMEGKPTDKVCVCSEETHGCGYDTPREPSFLQPGPGDRCCVANTSFCTSYLQQRLLVSSGGPSSLLVPAVPREKDHSQWVKESLDIWVSRSQIPFPLPLSPEGTATQLTRKEARLVFGSPAHI